MAAIMVNDPNSPKAANQFRMDAAQCFLEPFEAARIASARSWISGGADFKRGGDLEDVGQAWVALAALDAADVGAVEAAFVCESFLGYAALGANLADRVPERSVSWGANRHQRSFPS